MNSKLTYIIAILLYLTVTVNIISPIKVVGANEWIADSAELQFLDWINQARRNPLAMASSLGMDSDRIRRDFPELKNILANGLPALMFNDHLYVAASLHNADMFKNQLYGGNPLENDATCREYILKSGYAPSKTGESLGMIGFVNFITDSKAARDLFENMFIDELTPGRVIKQNILDPNFTEIGISIEPGTMNLANRNFNVYMAVCAFGTPMLKLELLQHINQFRANPLRIIASMDMDPEQVLNDLPEFYEILTQGLPPVWLNKNLDAAASLHNHDMFKNNYYGHNSLDNRMVEDRILDSGYNARVSGESLVMISTSDVKSSREFTETVFRIMLEAELDPLQNKTRMILNPDIEEVGICVEQGYFEIDEETQNIYLTTCDFASKINQTALNEVWKSQFFQLINQARAAPLAVAASLGIDSQFVLSELPDFHGILTKGSQPLTISDNLSEFEEDHIRIILDTAVDDTSNIQANADQGIESDHGFLAASESLEMVTFLEAMYPMDAITAIFEKMLRAELNPLMNIKRNILDPDLKQVGISFGFGDPEIDGLSRSMYVVALNFNSEPINDTEFIWGIVCRDSDQNSLYEPGEGISNFPIRVQWGHTPFGYMNAEVLLTNQTGGFMLPTKRGLHRLFAQYSDQQAECKLTILEDGKGMLFKIEPDTDDIIAIEY